MTLMGWFFIQNWCAYGIILFSHFYLKHGNYMVLKNIKVSSYNKGFNSAPFLLFIFLNSYYLFITDASSFIIDYTANKPYMMEFIFKSWDQFWSPEYMIRTYTPVAGYYKAENFYDYEQGDWGLPFDLKIHQFFICLWWVWLARKIVLNLKSYYKYFVS